MKMFDVVYLRLTAWYVLIIMIISLAFSAWVYGQTQEELQKSFVGLVHGVNEATMTKVPSGVFSQRLSDSQDRVFWSLVGLNMIVFVLGAGASYWLARRTMRPIEESVEQQNRFTADASHELRTPLAAMKTEIEVGLRDKQLSKHDAKTLLKSNLEEIDRLSALTDGLLTLTQTDTATLAPVRLDKTIRAVIKRMHPLAAVKNITFTENLAAVTVQTQEQTVDKIVAILLDNAIKYSLPATQIAVQLTYKNGQTIIQVSDQGMGIKASELPHIFDRFYRADVARSKAHVPGHGLGLAIAKKLTEELSGTIVAQSVLGKGSTFTVTL